MLIETLDLHDEVRATEVFDLYRAVHLAEKPDEPEPLPEPFLAEFRQDHPAIRVELTGVRHRGRLVGAGALVLHTRDNHHLAQGNLWVHPAHRRRRVGRSLLGHLTARARAEGRTTMVMGAFGPVPGGPARSDAGARFLTAMGFSPALTMTSRRVDLTAVDEASETELLATCRPHAAGYERLSWTGPTPDRMVVGVAHLIGRLAADAPTGDLEVEEMVVDAERLRTDERNTLARGLHLVGAVAVHRASRQVAALSQIEVRPPGDHGLVRLTIAHPEHRGRRLGTIVKINVHRRVRAEFPGIRFVTTGNADANAHMLTINERLGYVTYQTVTQYQLQLQLSD